MPAPPIPREGVAERSVERVAAGVRKRDRDYVAVEEPLEIRLASDPLAITMRTPGEDRFLAVGFLFAEGIIASIDDLGSVAHCGRPGDEGYGNVIDVMPGPGVVFDAPRLEGTRRGTLTTASCGVCGRRSIDDLLERLGVVDSEVEVRATILTSSPARLEEAQHRFAHTGGVHAAAAQAPDGTVLAHAEDIGRHNAVDKVVGHLLYERRLGSPEVAVLAVSGRVSFEIIQKAAAAGIPIVSAVSAPTSLAIDLAERAGITLAAFVRGGRMNVYTHPRRVLL
jgi:FdhD protein